MKHLIKKETCPYDRDYEAWAVKDTKKRTADRKSTRPQHELHDSPFVWYVLIALFVLWILWMGWQGLQAIVI